MKQFEYEIRDELGIHARPAGLVVKKAKEFESRITIKAGEKEADATKLMAVMSLCVKQGQSVVVSAEGSDEDAAIAAMQEFFCANL